MFSAARVVAIRKSKGLSQEVLAEQAGISLRTIQRVEQGDTVPRGHTLLALASALQVPLQELQAEQVPVAVASVAAVPFSEIVVAPQVLPASLEQGLAPAPPPTPTLVTRPVEPALRSDPDFLQLLNLSALSFLVLPLLNLVVPFLLWRARRHSIAHVAEVGRRVLGFQILWQVGCFFAYVLLAVGQIIAAQYQRAPLKGGFLWILLLTYLLNVATIGYYGWQLRRGNLAVYPVRL
ncbi:helix-turn-helix transcriptional regulator [Microvirga sp. STR05]|uniref:Helix-turn-helix transcriptional regulator n=1 Tax=Hymenobacter duratus TaxID=2771356 RepID=A0ABR8JME4_9BACT|nr:helix-turn-helix transcriptional regulator [Hymenobacter duratus]MBD2716908.1 helix-turn-helix transcriptional regulator [Hymenobacter duratus]MBR7951824.1 helix-turn-helix transcriptional regulator [Microvirga sp. STR05]